MNRLVRAGIAGSISTVVMSVPIYAAQRLNLVETPAPVDVSRKIAEEVSVLPEVHEPGFAVMWPLAHLAYGAGCGVIYAGMRPALPNHSLKAGMAFGALVWTFSYLGYLPLLRLYSWPNRDSKSRVTTMICAHGIFGATLGFLEKPLRLK